MNNKNSIQYLSNKTWKRSWHVIKNIHIRHMIRNNCPWSSQFFRTALIYILTKIYNKMTGEPSHKIIVQSHGGTTAVIRNLTWCTVCQRLGAIMPFLLSKNLLNGTEVQSNRCLKGQKVFNASYRKFLNN